MQRRAVKEGNVTPSAADIQCREAGVVGQLDSWAHDEWWLAHDTDASGVRGWFAGMSVALLVCGVIAAAVWLLIS